MRRGRIVHVAQIRRARTAVAISRTAARFNHPRLWDGGESGAGGVAAGATGLGGARGAGGVAAGATGLGGARGAGSVAAGATGFAGTMGAGVAGRGGSSFETALASSSRDGVVRVVRVVI